MVASTHVDELQRPNRKVGLRPTDRKRLKKARKMGRFLDTSTVPTHPPQRDYFSRVPQYLLGQNDKFGTCGPTYVANSALLTSTVLGDSPFVATDDEIFDLYRRSGNPDFDPRTGRGDNGVDMTVMLSELVRNGIGLGSRNVKALAYAAVAPGDLNRMWASAALFGSLGWGANLTEAQDQQMNGHPPVWDYVRRSRPWGGHAILSVGSYVDADGTANDYSELVTWQTRVRATDAFIQQQVPEQYLILWPWHLTSRVFMENTDLDTLAGDYTDITGKPFPAVVPPTPTPTPTPDPTPDPSGTVSDEEFWAMAKRWGAGRGFS